MTCPCSLFTSWDVSISAPLVCCLSPLFFLCSALVPVAGLFLCVSGRDSASWKRTSWWGSAPWLCSRLISRCPLFAATHDDTFTGRPFHRDTEVLKMMSCMGHIVAPMSRSRLVWISVKRPLITSGVQVNLPGT